VESDGVSDFWSRGIGMKKLVQGLTASCMLLGMTACTQPGETMTVATAAGGFIGAGLGAIIGSQTGAGGAGLVIGGAAGAGAGALVGNMLEQQEKLIAAQDESIVENQRRIDYQRKEVDSLREKNSDIPGGSPLASRSLTFQSNDIEERSLTDDSEELGSTDYANTLNEVTQSYPTEERGGEFAKMRALGSELDKQEVGSDAGRAGFRWNQETPRKVEMQDGPRTIPQETQKPVDNASEECLQAEEEVSVAQTEPEAREKLFRYRRALRMCPDNARYHNELGELYLEMNRLHDAEYEFNEAVRLDPGFDLAIRNLEELEG